jgi:GNAT superfamily N-acetyltransferase
MIRIRRTTVHDWPTWRDMRLTALRSAPTAYGETYANAVAGDDHYWQKWWLERSEDTAMRAMAYADDIPAGQVAVAQWRGPETNPTLISMWVQERFRGSGVADALVEDAVQWARDKGFAQIELGVTEGNEGARKLYLRHCFAPTGEFEALHSHPELRIETMVKNL